MPLVIIIIGVVFVIAGVRNSQGTLFSTLTGDFSGGSSGFSSSFLYWFLAIILIGAIGYVPKLKPISNAFLALVIVALFLSKKGFFAQFSSAINSGSGGASSNIINATQNSLEQRLANLQQSLSNELNEPLPNILNNGLPLGGQTSTSAPALTSVIND